jgi:peptidoglycan hydrolase-like protein with peptidoglycan-binding domain
VQAVTGTPLTGSYDWLTRNCVCDWQADNGLKPDGLVGPITYNKMFRG